MTLVIKIGADTKKLLRDLAKISSRQGFQASILRFFDRASSRAAGYVSRNMLSGQRLNRRTGTLARSILGRSELVKGVPGMRIGVFRGPALAYAGIHEEGGTIVPKKAKALAIPMGPSLTAAGVEKFGGPREYPGALKFVPFRSSGVAIGGLFDAASMGPNGLDGAILVYLLVTKVRIKAKHYLRDGVREYIDQQLIGELNEYLKSLIAGPKILGQEVAV